MTLQTSAGICRPDLAFDRLVEGLIAAYGGRDTSLLQRILWWKARFADRSCTQNTDEDPHAVLLDLECTPALGYRRSKGPVPKG